VIYNGGAGLDIGIVVSNPAVNPLAHAVFIGLTLTDPLTPFDKSDVIVTLLSS